MHLYMYMHAIIMLLNYIYFSCYYIHYTVIMYIYMVMGLCYFVIPGGLRDMLTVLFADKGTIARQEQEQAFIHFVDFLDKCVGKYTVMCLLIYIKGILSSSALLYSL